MNPSRVDIGAHDPLIAHPAVGRVVERTATPNEAIVYWPVTGQWTANEMISAHVVAPNSNKIRSHQ